MSETVTFQGYLFLITIISGVVIGLLYDIIRILRRVIKHTNLLINIEDGLFWVISSIFLFVVLFKQNDGRLRGFVILGVILGMLFYFTLISDFFVTNVAKAINYLIKVIGHILKVLFKPIKLLIKVMSKPAKWFLKLLMRFNRYFKKRLKNSIKTIKIIFKKI